MNFNVLKQFPYTIKLVGKFVKEVFPQVDDELFKWRSLGIRCPDKVLADQAIASIEHKRFHAQGGSIYALYPSAPPHYTKFVVALQTISDYLDNLCDRVGFMDEQGFRQVHFAMLDALDSTREMADYYKYYPYQEDGGYLVQLVKECRQYQDKLPSYQLVKKEILELAELYCDLQTYKHLPWEIRESALIEWAAPHLKKYQDLTTWEFAAATGSTLGIFILGAMAANDELTSAEVTKVREAYFPWICGLHILLDYFIDQEEDRKEGDLNFVFYYKDQQECNTRLRLFLQQGMIRAAELQDQQFHYAVIQGMLAMYLSDIKTKSPYIKEISQNLIQDGGNTVRLLHGLCLFLRWKKVI
ncbi:MAG: tetraprenyl-beta-curcumene synthase family protein [Bacillota bacterium]|nr:tetraprenyl-beta-curcumene synthase family protein [Bacillota bacterium]